MWTSERPPPALRLDHLSRLIDDIRIIQFARGAVPDPASGYCVDDVARLAVVAAGLLRLGAGGETSHRWVAQSIRFLGDAIPAIGETGPGLHNLPSHRGAWLDGPSVSEARSSGWRSIAPFAPMRICEDSSPGSSPSARTRGPDSRSRPPTRPGSGV